MRAFFRFVTWPAIAGVLAALLILDNWISRAAAPGDALVSRRTYRTAVAKATPSVVNIYTETERVITDRAHLLRMNQLRILIPWGVPRKRIERSLGSGVIMRSEGYILTNHHVVAGATAINVLLSDGRSAPAEPIGEDVDTDLAVLKIDLDNLNPMELADSDTLSVGDVVLAIGNPLGFSQSVTQGIISGLGRDLNFTPGTFEELIQTDAVIHAGNSGGALVDAGGKLIGINRLIYTANDGGSGMTGIGISLAIPSNTAEFVMDDLIRYGRVIRGWFGVSVVEAQAKRGAGLLVLGVAPDGPAARAGLKTGDIITHFDKQPIDNVRLSMRTVSRLRPGDRLSITVERQTSVLDLDAVIGAQAARPANGP